MIAHKVATGRADSACSIGRSSSADNVKVYEVSVTSWTIRKRCPQTHDGAPKTAVFLRQEALGLTGILFPVNVCRCKQRQGAIGSSVRKLSAADDCLNAGYIVLYVGICYKGDLGTIKVFQHSEGRCSGVIWKIVRSPRSTHLSKRCIPRSTIRLPGWKWSAAGGCRLREGLWTTSKCSMRTR
jgi:hypothetical protein